MNNYDKIGKLAYDNDGKVFGVVLGKSNQGWIYKDEEAFKLYPDKICYIPEYAVDEEECIVIPNGLGYGENLELYLIKTGYTANDFLDMCDGNKTIAYAVFDMVDWQFPETYLEELYSYGEVADCPNCNRMYLSYEVDTCPYCNCKIEK